MEKPQSLKFVVVKDTKTPGLECKYAEKTDLDNAQINTLQQFTLNLDCQKNHYEVNFFGKIYIQNDTIFILDQKQHTTKTNLTKNV